MIIVKEDRPLHSNPKYNETFYVVYLHIEGEEEPLEMGVHANLRYAQMQIEGRLR